MNKSPYYTAHGVTLHLGDCLDILHTLPDASVDSVVTDPPYGLAEHSAATLQQALTAWMGGDRSHVPNGRGFMGKDWDAFVPPPAVWDECLRVLKPGGHLVAFAGARTVDLMGVAIRLAGFEVRESLMWLHGQGFPKSLDVSKAIDKAAGAQREVTGTRIKAGAIADGRMHAGSNEVGVQTVVPYTAPATPDAARWSGFGTALKPAHEPIILARRPLAGTVAANVLAHGTGALNIDGCRVGNAERVNPPAGNKSGGASLHMSVKGMPRAADPTMAAGRWPTNVVLSHPPLIDEHGEPVGDACADGCVDGCPVAEMDAQSGVTVSSGRVRRNTAEAHNRTSSMGKTSADWTTRGHDDHGGASRFFPVFRYQAKASPKERPRLLDGTAHPTVKPLPLMSWLVRLVTPPGGTVLEPFAGSGTTLEACAFEGFQVIGIERHEPYAELCRLRLAKPIAASLPA